MKRLFKAVDLWATKTCERQGLAADGASKRRIRKEQLIKRIRFPTRKLEEFACVVLDSDILTKEEVFSIIKHLTSVSRSQVGFLETKRCGFQLGGKKNTTLFNYAGHTQQKLVSRWGGDIQRCCRFDSVFH